MGSMADPFQFSLFGEDEAPSATPAEPISNSVNADLDPHKLDTHPVLTREIPYTLKRVRARSIHLRIGVNGLEVTAPKWVSIRAIEEAIEEKRAWIEKKMTERDAWRKKEQISSMRFEEKGLIPYRGGRIEISLGHAKTELLADAKTLTVALPLGADTTRIRETVRAWLYAKAEQLIGARLKFYSETTGLIPSSWHLTNAHGRWGSCSAKRVVRLSWRLIFFTDDVIDYVVVHELTHLAHMDHSASFWKAVEAVYPNYVEVRTKLMGVPLGELIF